MSYAKKLFLIPGLAAILVGFNSTLAEEPSIEYHGAGWLGVGRVEKSLKIQNIDANNQTHNWLQNSGGNLTASAKFNQDWVGNLGLGTVMVHLARGDITNSGIWYPFSVPLVPEVSLNYSHQIGDDDHKVRLTFGYFPYSYSSDNKDLGQYLLHGYVYPGTIVSGFGSLFGSVLGVQLGGFKNDFILNSETEDKPLYDVSIADIASYSIGKGLELGAGLNFYRAISANSKLTSHGKDCSFNDLGPFGRACFEIDSVGIDKDSNTVYDTITGSLAGTKVMGRFRIDPKAYFTTSVFGNQDLVFYGEAAILGLKSFGVYYNDIKRRIPVMLGFNFPVFGFLDFLSIESEYYANKNSADILGAEHGSWIPAKQIPVVNTARDDWKYAITGSKVFMGHFKASAMAANDHMRLGGTHNVPYGLEATKVPTDWYWTANLAYFF